MSTVLERRISRCENWFWHLFWDLNWAREIFWIIYLRLRVAGIHTPNDKVLLLRLQCNYLAPFALQPPSSLPLAVGLIKVVLLCVLAELCRCTIYMRVEVQVNSDLGVCCLSRVD